MLGTLQTETHSQHLWKYESKCYPSPFKLQSTLRDFKKGSLEQEHTKPM